MKRASSFGMGVVAAFLLLLVGFVLFSPLFEGILDLITKGGKESACKWSLFQGKGTAKCPIEQIYIFKDEVQIDGKKFVGKDVKGTQIMAKEALAKFLTMCLSRGGGYNSRAFSSEYWLETESVCLQCFKVKIDEKVGVLQDFTSYLRDTKAKSTVLDKRYLEVLTKDSEHLEAYMKFGMGLGISPSQGTFEFKPNQDYIIFFIGLKKGYAAKGKEMLWDAANLNLLKAAFANRDTYFAYVAEAGKLRNTCDRLVN